MNKHLSWILILAALAAVSYAISKGWIALFFGYFFLLVGFAMPFLLSYWIRAEIFVPKWIILLWAGLMVYTVGVIAEPALLAPIGSLVCPDGFPETSVAVESTPLYDGAINTAAVLSCLGESATVQPGSGTVLLAGVGLYILIFLPMLLVAALVARFRKPEWGPGRCFVCTQLLYWPLLALAFYLPGFTGALRAGAQALIL